MAAIDSAMLIELEPKIIAEATLKVYEFSRLLPLVRVKDTSGKPGLTTTFPKFPTVVAEDVAEHEETPETDVDPDAVEVKVSEKELNIPITDLAAEAAGEEELIAILGTLLGSGMARKLDRDIASTFSQFIKSFGTAGASLAIGSVSKGVTFLDVQEAPGQLYGALHPYQSPGIKDTLTNSFGDGSKNVPSEMKANEILYANYIGTLSGAHFLETPAIRADGNDDAYGAVFSPLAIGVNMKKMFEFEPERRGRKRITHLLGHGMWGAKAINTDWGVKLLSDCSEPS
ncbi:hypothetical protein OO185_02510 [Prosthecochloris sp. SCSIO W1102]|uniref:phage major capsid protein n=1 Tax=Prosthecochloris sp. SCSIO W1102 TaxID=2992243 RepID=UPI00223D6FE2|nr:hypothetical protein [Prosthecochloris sp. SCSIO W1102]UZJ39993.1 hypothetical protein OO185_02510 [Prosthecochloris sp. SCSIO W1102]